MAGTIAAGSSAGRKTGNATAAAVSLRFHGPVDAALPYVRHACMTTYGVCHATGSPGIALTVFNPTASGTSDTLTPAAGIPSRCTLGVSSFFCG